MNASASSEILLQSLRKPTCYPHPVDTIAVLETHISWVILAGCFAYKIKKPLDLGFLDFSALTKRRFYCEEEIRLNRRLAPDLYLDVIAIGGDAEQPVLGAEPAFEYALKMQRFDTALQMDNLLENGLLTTQHIDHLATTLAQFHSHLPAMPLDSEFGTAASIAAPARENFQRLKALLPSEDGPRLAVLATASEAEFSRCREGFEQRRQAGWVRECHGDLHLGNIVVLAGQPTPFDALEFSASLRCIDVISDLAFLLMDLQQRDRADLAFRLLNAYLAETGDFAGIGVLRFYLGYRAMVRAKVAAIRAAQLPSSALLLECRHYLRQADMALTFPCPALIITHGLPGCGKTTVAQQVLEKIGAIRLRSDVERKRMFGLATHPSRRASLDNDIYSAEATTRTYQRLHELADKILAHGYSVIVDAAFLLRHEREQFRQLAAERELPFVILSVNCADWVQRQRIEQRQRDNNDASEADVNIYLRLQALQQALAEEEMARVIAINNEGGIEQLAKNSALWLRLDILMRLK